MSLLSVIQAAPKPLVVNYAYLLANANTKQATSLAKRKALFETKVVLNVAATEELKGCRMLSEVLNLPKGISFTEPGKLRPMLTKSKEDVKHFISAFLLFGVDDPERSIINEFGASLPSGQFRNLSQSFVDKHFATGATDAQKKSSDRYGLKNDIKVSTFLYGDDITLFQNEVQDCYKVLFKFLERVFQKEKSYRARNKRIEDLIVRSGRTYTKIQCTLNGGFVPTSYGLEYMWYGISTPDAHPVILCDHYVPKVTLFPRGENLNPAWKELDYLKFTEPTDRPVLPVKLYVKYGRFD